MSSLPMFPRVKMFAEKRAFNVIGPQPKTSCVSASYVSARTSTAGLLLSCDSSNF